MKRKFGKYANRGVLALVIFSVAVAGVDAQVTVEALSSARPMDETKEVAPLTAATERSVSRTVSATEASTAEADGGTDDVRAMLVSNDDESAAAVVAQAGPVKAKAVAAQVPADNQIEATEQAGEEEAAGDDSVRLSVKDADLSGILKLLAEQHRLNIVAGKDVKGTVTADFYGVTVDEALKAVLEMNGYGYIRENNFIKVYTLEQLQLLERAQAKIVTRIFRLNYVNVDEAKELLRPALSKTAVISTNSRAVEGIPSGGSSVGGDSYSLSDKIVIRDYEENVLECERLLKEIDVRPTQVLVEATILAVTLDDNTSVGVDFNLLAGVDFRGTSAVTIPISNPNSIVPGGATAPLASIPFASAGTAGFAPPGNGLNVGVITNDVSMFIRALETVEDVNVLSNPKIMALNKQRAEVLVGERLGYRTTTVTQTTAIETVEFLDTGTQLRFRPFISNEGFIRMEIHPEVSTGNIDALGLPSQTTTEVTCNIIVRDGHTVVIGGLFDESTQIDKSQVPLLGSMPLLGALFRNHHTSTRRREIIVLLTPHILNHDLMNAEGQETLDRIERQVTGLRSAFPCYTREKLTQLHLMEADKYCTRYLQSGSAGDRMLAIWNLKLARNVAPNNVEVITRLDEMEAEAALSRPRLQNESILWRRMHGSGMFDELPEPPASSPVEIEQNDVGMNAPAEPDVAGSEAAAIDSAASDAAVIDANATSNDRAEATTGITGAAASKVEAVNETTKAAAEQTGDKKLSRTEGEAPSDDSTGGGRRTSYAWIKCTKDDKVVSDHKVVPTAAIVPDDLESANGGVSETSEANGAAGVCEMAAAYGGGLLFMSQVL